MAGLAASSLSAKGWPVLQLPHEELRVTLAYGHDLHVAAFASGPWNVVVVVRYTMERGIGCNLSLADDSHI